MVTACTAHFLLFRHLFPPSKCLLPAFGVIFLLLLPGCSSVGYSVKAPSAETAVGECVILLHGMGRRYHSMSDMQERLLEAGYHTVNVGYPSTRATVETIVEDYFAPALMQCRNSSPGAIHFVTHSLGGIVVRMGILQQRPAELGRVVMLSPPNQGSSLVDSLYGCTIYKWVNGPAGQQLSTAPDSLPNRLGPVDYPVGVITGDRYAFFDSWFSHIIPGIDDGKVSVEQARLEGMSDFLVVHASHPFIMDSDYVQDETVHFLQSGAFRHHRNPVPPAAGADWFSLPSN